MSRSVSLYKILSISCVAIIIITLIYLFVDNQMKETFEQQLPDFGIVITRHVTSQASNRIWKKCLQQVRRFYPTEPVVIIDDNSNYEFVNTENVDMTNVSVVDSEIKRAGEMLPYHYFYKEHWFKRMLFIHDSVFIESRIDDSSVSGAKTLWHFINQLKHTDETATANELIQFLNYKQELEQLLPSNNSWKGSYGVMCIIDHDYLVHIMEKYNIENMIPHIDSRIKRMACERLFGLLLSHDNPEFVNNPSIFGDYTHSFNNRLSQSYDYEAYMEDVSSGNMRAPINKLFFGR